MAIIGEEPLLLSSHDHLKEKKKKKKKKGLLLVWVKWFLEMAMLLVSISWLILVFLFSMQWFNMSYKSWLQGSGTSDKVLLVFSSPILIVALLAMAHQMISDSQGEEERLKLKKRSSEKASYRLSTFPVMVDHQVLGVVSAAEVLGIVIVVLYLIWTLILYTITNIQELADAENKMYVLFKAYGVGLGDIGSYAMTLLFVPVTRGSSLLRLINVPFEHAIKYHIWLGNLTVFTFTLHGLSMALSYASEGNFKAIFSWESNAAANLAGVIALLIILSMFVSSLHCIRRKYFESFYYMHQLYVLFLIFFALHVGDFFLAVPAGAILVYLIDRFLRFCQSRGPVDVVSCKYLSCGVVELALAKPTNLRYNALSFVFLRIREVSRLQWHPFSVCSSPEDGKDHLRVMIKARGQWTSKLLSLLKNNVGDESQHQNLTAFVEGPYGHDLPYYLMYKDLVLVAGGIGISPFFAIVNDIFARVENDKPCLVKNILLIWAVKTSNKLQLLSNLSSTTSQNLVRLETQVHVTQERSCPPTASTNGRYQPPVQVITRTNHSGRHMISNLVGTGSGTWHPIYFIFCITSLVIFKASWDILLNKSIVSDSIWWVNGIVLLAGMAGAVVVFGGLVLGFWRIWEAKTAGLGQIDRREEDCLVRDDIRDVRYGSRPDMGDIFESVRDMTGDVDVGVIVCGPSGLESSAAAQCRRLNLGRNCDQPIFHFHSHSFRL